MIGCGICKIKGLRENLKTVKCFLLLRLKTRKNEFHHQHLVINSVEQPDYCSKNSVMKISCARQIDRKYILLLTRTCQNASKNLLH